MFLIFSCLYGTRGENNIFQQFYYGRERHLGRHDRRRRRYKPVRRENAVYRFFISRSALRPADGRIVKH